MQFVRLVNQDHRPFDFHQMNKKRILQPGDEVMVPWDIATTLFGDPSTTDTPLDQARTRVHKQARGQFGYEDGGMTNEEWEAKRPKIEVYDVETGQRIYMVIEDPDGAKFSGVPAPDELATNAAGLQDQIARLERQVQQLVQLQLQNAPASQPQGASPLPSQDAPEVPLTGGGALPLAQDVPGEDLPQATPTGAQPKAPKSKLAPKPD